MNTSRSAFLARIQTKSLVWIFLLGTCLSASAAQERPGTPVNVAEAVMSKIFPTAWVSGSVVSNNDAEIAAQVGGRLIAVANVGDSVKAGEIIAQIDDMMIGLEIKELQANVDSARHNHKFLKKEVTRKRGLAKENLSSQTDLDQTISDRDVAKATLAGAQARLAQAQQRLAYTKIYAPFNGVVTNRLSKLGEVVSNGSKVIQLVETVDLEVTAQVPLTSYHFLQKGDDLEIKSPLGKTTAKIRAIVPVADSRSHLMELRLTLAQSNWPVGLNVRVAAPTGQAQTLLVVPRDAIVLRREGNTVFRINADNKAERISVTLGIASGSLMAINGDIKAGDNVVIRGSERLQPGQAVAIKENNEKLVSLQNSNP